MRWFLFAILALPAAAQIARSQLGLMLDANGGLRPVYGVPGSSTLGDPLLTGVLSAGCVAELCLAKTQDTLWNWRSATGEWAQVSAPAGPALFAFMGADAFVLVNGALYRWSGGALALVPFLPHSPVLALRAASDGFDYAVSRDGATVVEHLSLIDGSVNAVSSAAGDGLMALLDSSVLIASDDASKIVRGDGTEISLPVSGVQKVQWLGDGFLQATTAEANFVIRIESGREQVFLLPGVTERLKTLRPIRRPGQRSGQRPGQRSPQSRLSE
jgi:hypothetical protein